jgi:hypothetical protein
MAHGRARGSSPGRRSALSTVDRLVAADVDRQVRSWEKASDHAPTWIELGDAGGNRAHRRGRPRTGSGRYGGWHTSNYFAVTVAHRACVFQTIRADLGSSADRHIRVAIRSRRHPKWPVSADQGGHVGAQRLQDCSTCFIAEGRWIRTLGPALHTHRFGPPSCRPRDGPARQTEITRSRPGTKRSTPASPPSITGHRLGALRWRVTGVA